MAQMRQEKKGAAVGEGSKRERVVSAAAKLFLDEGYGTTGMDAIAKEAGVSKATVYSYYEDKASLFAEVMMRMCDEIGGHDVERLVLDSPDATLKAVAVFCLQRVLESLDRSILQRVVAESKEFPELGKKFWATGPGKLEEFVAGYLADAHRRGLLEVKDPVGAAARFVGLVTGIYLLPMLVGTRSRPSERELRRDLDEVIAGFLAPLRQKPRSALRRQTRGA
jgi:TetR/AcrR family transcriptional regulator, mexJK operon transcriptional repressor